MSEVGISFLECQGLSSGKGKHHPSVEAEGRRASRVLVRPGSYGGEMLKLMGPHTSPSVLLVLPFQAVRPRPETAWGPNNPVFLIAELALVQPFEVPFGYSVPYLEKCFELSAQGLGWVEFLSNSELFLTVS